ncbi:hypothetical protein AABM38_13795 [Heyndrickxia sp. MSNUG]|uniref:hypothetical protein n=1 Tax=Heyndrickxia sp. MSNUG TaxID=3136677 RepID=UPI003C2DA17E
MELPTILGGPILRRAEPSCIYIWIALSRKLEIGAELFHILESETTETVQYLPLDIGLETKTIKAGDQLYVSLIKIMPKDKAFPPYTLLGYNLLFKRGVLHRDLGSFDLLTPGHTDAIVYGNLKYPAFYIDYKHETTRILYGSCRKPHGNGNDAFSAADLLLHEQYQDLSERPSALFLMGDQIYADDVADPLIPILGAVGKTLYVNQGATLPEGSLINDSLSPRLNKINGRQYLIEHLAKFTTRNGDNHLVCFNEYAVMYLMVWNPELWHYVQENELLLSFQQVIDRGMLHLKFDQDKKIRKKELKKLKARYEEQLDHLRNFIPSVSAARRVMANTPTYMIFDDHDITDDWNISPDWTESVSHSPLGQHIVTNGLAAYWLFQGWGNDPETFDQNFLKSIQKYIESKNSQSEEYLYGIKMLSEFQSWHFVAPTIPKTVFLDTRTQREFDPRPKPVKLLNIIEETTRTPFLISNEAWDQITQKLKASGWKNNTPLNIVSPSPVYGMGLIESFLHKYVYPFKVLGIPVQTSFDFDSWKYNGKGFNSFIRTVSKWKPSYCVLLSGDVHFSTQVKSEIQYDNGDKLFFFQAINSPIVNESFTGIWGGLMKTVMWFNARKRKKYTLHRLCDQEYNLTLQTQPPNKTSNHLWTETIQYLPFEDNSIIETTNSIGSLKNRKGKIENTLLIGSEKVNSASKILFNLPMRE